MPGTFCPPADDDDRRIQYSTDSMKENIATVDTVSTSVIATVESTTDVSIFAVGSTFFYIMIGVAFFGGGIIFSFIIIICILVGYSVRRKRKPTSYTFITDTMLQTNNGIMQDRVCCILITL